jgi:hypothetical protein
MQMIQSGYKSVSFVFELGADRILVPLALVISLATAAAIGLEIAQYQAPATQGLF